MKREWIRPLFVVAALYDLVLGVVFLVAFKTVYRWYGVTLPNHDGYIQFAACVVAIFGLGFWMVSRDPERNRDLIKLGVLFKASYSGVVLGHAALGSMPSMWIPFAWIDLLFLVSFLAALRAIRGDLTRTAPLAS
jgi:hypothetical protein